MRPEALAGHVQARTCRPLGGCFFFFSFMSNGVSCKVFFKYCE